MVTDGQPAAEVASGWSPQRSFAASFSNDDQLSFVADRDLSVQIMEEESDMKIYLGSDIRNVAVVGHAHCGKTTLISALLHAAKMTTTRGRVEDGSAVTAYDEEEVARRTTMPNAVAFAEWDGIKINL